MGVVFEALIDVLDRLRQSHLGHSTLLSYSTKRAMRLERNGTHGQMVLAYEASCYGITGKHIERSGTDMFIYGFLDDTRERYLDKYSVIKQLMML